MKVHLPFNKLDRWEQRFVSLALHVSAWSKDPVTRVGAVIAGRKKTQVALGYNGFPPFVKDSEERLNDPEVKRLLTQHAERNVLDNASFDVTDGTLYTTFFPCHECAKSIVTRGIDTVVGPPPVSREPWATSQARAVAIFEEAGVDIVFYNGS